MRDDGIERRRRDQAEVRRTRRRACGFGLEFTTGLMQVEFLGAEFQRRASGAESLDAHAEHIAVEIAGSPDVGDGEHEMVETAYFDHGKPLALNGRRCGCI